MMDDIARHNRERWNELVRLNVEFSRPWLKLDEQQARTEVDPHGFIGNPKGKEVLCLAGAGGQQSAAFALLGAQVTVLDLSDEMLARDRQAAAHYGFDIRFEQGDMRDLSRFTDHSFDIVWHAYSINFVPEVAPVFDEVARVLKTGGIYQVQFHNPFIFDVDERSWNGQGYLIHRPYIDGQEAQDPTWDIYAEDGSHREVQGPREFRHILSTMLNSLLGRGFTFLGLYEDAAPDPDAEPGTWDHYLLVCAPLVSMWLRKSG
jgi:SAM-dependent methyltransferase